MKLPDVYHQYLTVYAFVLKVKGSCMHLVLKFMQDQAEDISPALATPVLVAD